MSDEILKLTAEIIVAHASTAQLSTQELIDAIKGVHNALVYLEAGEVIPEAVAPESEVVKKPSILLKDIVKAKYVVCLECGKKFRILKAHIKRAHGLTPKEYFKRFDLDPKKYPLVCKEYSAQRSKMALDRGFGAKGTHHKGKA